jgi:hypothetical protein
MLFHLTMLSLAFGNVWFTYRHFNQLMYVMKHKSEAVKTAAVILSHMQKDDENFKMPQKQLFNTRLIIKIPSRLAGMRDEETILNKGSLLTSLFIQMDISTLSTRLRLTMRCYST